MEAPAPTGDMDYKRSYILVVLFILLVGMLVWTFYNFAKFQTARQEKNTVSQPEDQSSVLPSGVIAVRSFNYGYSPNELVAKQGETVKIRLVSDDSPHTFTIDELGINQEFTWGKDVDLSFVAGKKGKFRFYCAVPGHKEGGMVGTLTIE